jgi:hypothetical protein
MLYQTLVKHIQLRFDLVCVANFLLKLNGGLVLLFTFKTSNT